jgi:hypothetical protein
MALASATQEAFWMRSLLKEFGLNMPTTFWCDNKGAIDPTYNLGPIYHKITKHLDISSHFIGHIP